MGTLQFKRVTQTLKNIDFSCGIPSIDEYIKESYYPILTQHAYAYSIMKDDVVIGYYQVLLREIKIEDFPDEISEYKDESLIKDTISAVHIRYIAIDQKYQKKKLGSSTLKVIIKKVQELSGQWPVRVITIDSLVELEKWYQKQGFKKMNANSPWQDGMTIRMFFDCHRFTKDLKDYVYSMI